MEGAIESHWFESAFRRGYLQVYPHRTLEAARTEISGLLDRGLAGRMLDLGCGFGRHALALLEAGHVVFGLDLSFELLVHARDLPGGERLAGRLLRGDSRRLPVAEAAFDAVVMLFSSFGYFDDRENAEVLTEVARVLRPGGTAILDLMNPERIRAGLVPESTTQREGFVLFERRSLEAYGRRVVKHVELVRDDGAVERWHEDVRMYGTNEMRALCAPRGLDFLQVEGDFDGSPYDSGPDGSPRQILWLRRARQ